MWHERRSSQSTPSHTPPQSRSYSPAQRRPGPAPLPPRPSIHPRSSSLSLASTPNVSVTNLANVSRIPQGSSLRNEIRDPTPHDVPDPLEVLGALLGKSLKTATANGEVKDNKIQHELIAEIDFKGLSLEDFVKQGSLREEKVQDVHSYTVRSIEEYDREKEKFEDLHKSIAACDQVLQSVETYLTGFQADLGNVSAEIETLQTRSTAMNTKLENRKVVEKLLGPLVEDLSLPPAIVRKISDGPVDEGWSNALAELEKRIKAMEVRKKEQQTPLKAMEDLAPLLENLSNRAVQRIRDYFVAQIKALRSPSINAQIIQKDNFLKYKELFAFLARHQRKLAEEIGQAYINTIRWYYSNHFTRYDAALKAIKLHSIDKNDLIGQQDDPQLKRPAKGAAPATYDAFSLGRRMDALKAPTRTALPSHIAEEDKSSHYLETPFRSFNLALIDNACFEYTFLSSFFSPIQNFHAISRTFETIFAPTFALGHNLTRHLVGDNGNDALGILLCVRLNGQMAFELQRRKVPAAEGYVNGTNILLWPRFQQVMDLHCDSLKRSTAALSGRASGASSLLSSSSAASAQSTAPHALTQRFASFLLGILALSGEASDGEEPVSRSLGRLRGEYENFLMKLSKSVGDARKRERFLFNNFSLVGTILEESPSGRLADEMKAHFAELKETYAG